MNSNEKITNLYFNSLEEFKKLENTPRDFGTGDLLYRSESHSLQVIGKKSNINLTELACELDVTKSAASKVVNKLLQKELITKNKQVNNKKEVVFNLAPKGEVAYKGHQEFSQKNFASIYQLLDSLKSEERAFLTSFLKDLTARVRENQDM